MIIAERKPLEEIKEMIADLDLLRPIYKKTACYGHYGRSEPEFTWEQTDMVDILKERAGL